MIEDEMHAELHGEYDNFEDALDELKKRSKMPWDQSPNICPCTSWETCHRLYQIIEYDDTITPWTTISRVDILKIGSAGVKWLDKFKSD